MKKYIFLLLSLIVFKVQAQNGNVFKVEYKSAHRYQMVSDFKIQLTGNLTGDTAIINKIKSQGIEQPINLNLDMALNIAVITGKSNGVNGFPLIFTKDGAQVSAEINGSNIPIPPNAEKKSTISAHVMQDGTYRIDSVRATSLKDTSVKFISQIINGLQHQIRFPDHPLKIGESFTQEVPIVLPFTPSNNSIVIKVSYTLLKISEGNAYFEMVNDLNASLSLKNIMVNISGTGVGMMVYSLKDQFPTQYDNELKINLDAFFMGIKATATGKLTTKNSCLITIL